MFDRFVICCTIILKIICLQTAWVTFYTNDSYYHHNGSLHRKARAQGNRCTNLFYIAIFTSGVRNGFGWCMRTCTFASYKPVMIFNIKQFTFMFVKGQSISKIVIKAKIWAMHTIFCFEFSLLMPALTLKLNKSSFQKIPQQLSKVVCFPSLNVKSKPFIVQIHQGGFSVVNNYIDLNILK